MLLIRKKLGKYLVLYKSLKSDMKIDADWLKERKKKGAQRKTEREKERERMKQD